MRIEKTASDSCRGRHRLPHGGQVGVITGASAAMTDMNRDQVPRWDAIRRV